MRQGRIIAKLGLDGHDRGAGLLRDQGSPAAVMVGGIIPAIDRAVLVEAGVSAIVEPGQQTEAMLTAACQAMDGLEEVW
jgi:methylmalonyl-CoA mutase cobalamin-binding subunit